MAAREPFKALPALDRFDSPAGYYIVLTGPFGALGYRVLVFDFHNFKHRYRDFPPDQLEAARRYCDLWRI
jgi:hypothetical protein